MGNNFIKLDSWVKTILRDPLDKSELIFKDDKILSSYGTEYKILNGICDFKFLPCRYGTITPAWKKFQEEHEAWEKNVWDQAKFEVYQKEKEIDSEVYKIIPITGRTLDVRGSLGRIRTWMDMDQEYLVIDPYQGTFDKLDSLHELKKAYPRLNEQVNFICGFAEHLPLASLTFDHVHMRSILDHLYNPELAIAEARRVLRDSGALVIALYIEGGKNEKFSLKEKIKHKLPEYGKTFNFLLKDHHLWHPTYSNVVNLLGDFNFQINREHWLSGIKNVCYLEAIKC